MVNVNDVYLKVRDILNKNQNGVISPAEFNRLSSIANIDLFNFYYGKPTAYRPEKPLPRVAYANTMYVSEALAPFLIENAPVSVMLGVANIPSDKIHAVDIKHNYTVNATNKTASFRRVEQDRLSSWLNSSIDSPTLEFPIYTEGSDTIHIFPSSITNITFTYLRTPNNPVWNYTIVSGRPVYNAGTSVNFEWDSTEINNLVMRIVSLSAASLKDADIVAYAENSKKGEA